MFLDGAAAAGRHTLGVVAEKIPVALLDVGVAVVSGRGHEGDVAAQVVIGIVAAVLIQGFDQQVAQRDVRSATWSLRMRP